MPVGKTRTVLVPRMGADGKTVLETKRINAGFSLTALAKTLGVARDGLWRYEQPEGKNRRYPRPTTAKRIADALGMAVEDLFEQVTEEVT